MKGNAAVRIQAIFQWKRVRFRGLAHLLAAVALLSLPQISHAAAPAVTVSDARLGVHPAKTRFVVDLTGQVAYRIFSLKDPYRLVIDLPEVAWKMPFASGRRAGGDVSSIRYNLFKQGTSRIVLDLSKPMEVVSSFILPPGNTAKYRLVIDLRATDAARFNAAAGWPMVAPPPVVPRAKEPVAPALAKKIIVIDPGHGGKDPGAPSKSGATEKSIVLTMAKLLKKDLEKTGAYKAVLTREGDTALHLRERIAIARKNKADLFISLHADTLPGKRSIRGTSFYTLSEKASDKEAAALAHKENQADVLLRVDMSDNTEEVNNILIDLAMRETKNRSVRFAGVLVSELGKTTRLLKNPHRYAGFAVLKAPDVPSVLVELGYLSNQSDEKNLRSSSWRKKVSGSIVRAIDGYFDPVAIKKASR